MQLLFEKYRDQGFDVVAVEAVRDTERARKFIETHGLTYTLLENGDAESEIVGSLFGVYGFPTSFLVDREGRVMYHHVGFEAGDEVELEEQIKTLLTHGLGEIRPAVSSHSRMNR